jgi:DNA-binding GntR family transcriptional regulator
MIGGRDESASNAGARFFVKPQTEESLDALDEQVTRGHFRQQVTARILAGVFQGRFRSGGRLVVQHLTQLYGVSPTPVRESFVELASLGIVELLPNRGAVVLPFGLDEVRGIVQIRRVLEVEAARCASGRIGNEALEALERELSRLGELLAAPEMGGSWIHDARAADTRLHGLIAASCGSRRLKAEIDRYLTLWRPLRNVSQRLDVQSSLTHAVAMLAEHQEIVRALQGGDPDAVARAMDRHIRSAGQILEVVLVGAPVETDASAGGDPRAESARV